MGQAALERMLRAGKITAEEVLARAPLARLDDTLTFAAPRSEGDLPCADGADRERFVG
jgi:hypothetical protein